MPYKLRYRLAWDHELCRKVLGCFLRTVFAFERARGREQGVPDGQCGALTVIQRFGSALNLNIHFHAIIPQGVFAEASDGEIYFEPGPPPSR
ncbi:MAG: transposase, partial [bacterium]